MSPRRAVFLDRDGTINENRADHVKTLDEFVFLPGATAAIRLLASTPLAIIIISNQSVINRGLATTAAVQSINQRLVDAIRADGGRIDGIYLCPHRPDEDCPCRKPRPGLLYQARHDYDLDLVESYVVGDAVSDVELALRTDCIPILVLTGRGAAHVSLLTPQQRDAVHICPNLMAAAEWILTRETQPKAQVIA